MRLWQIEHVHQLPPSPHPHHNNVGSNTHQRIQTEYDEFSTIIALTQLQKISLILFVIRHPSPTPINLVHINVIVTPPTKHEFPHIIHAFSIVMILDTSDRANMVVNQWECVVRRSMCGYVIVVNYHLLRLHYHS